MNRFLVALLCASTIAITALSCGGGGGGTTPTANPPATNPPSATPTRVIGVSGNLAFGSVAVGNTTTSPFTISNSGTATLTVSNIAMSSGLASAYSTNWTGGTIAAGGSQQVILSFAPPAAQAYNGTLTVNGDQTSGTNTIAISGTGTAAPGGNCTYTLSIGNSIDGYPDGTSLAVTVTTGAGCAWSPSSNASWLHVSGSGTGTGSFTISIDANTSSAPRTGTITVGGRTVTVNQTANAPAALSPNFTITSTVQGVSNACRIESSGDPANPALIKCVFDASPSTPASAITGYQFDLVNTGKTLGNQMRLSEPKTSCGFPFNAQVTIRLTITSTDGRTATTTMNTTFTKLSSGPC